VRFRKHRSDGQDQAPERAEAERDAASARRIADAQERHSRRRDEEARRMLAGEARRARRAAGPTATPGARRGTLPAPFPASCASPAGPPW